MKAKAMRFSISDSLRIGWESAKTNRLPMAVLWTIAAILAVSYYCVPPVARALVPLADWQTKWGSWAGAANQMFFCGVSTAYSALPIPKQKILLLAIVLPPRIFLRACQQKSQCQSLRKIQIHCLENSRAVTALKPVT